MAYRLILTALLASAAIFPAYAQEEQPPAEPAGPPAPEAPAAAAEAQAEAAAQAPDELDEEDEEEGEAIVVTGQRERGAVIGDIAPEVQLDRRDIQAYGASNIAELLDALAPQTRSGRGRGEGRPVVLLNGRRISGFREIRNLPPEAIQRVDILPEEVALKYGYRADQRVVNFVTRRRFRAVTAEVDGGFTTDGGRESYGAEANMLRIDRQGRWNIEAEYQHAEPLLESERDLVSEFGRFRTLLPQTDQFTLGGTINRTILDDISATLNASFEANDSESRFGLFSPDATRPLTREVESRTGHLGVALNGEIAPPWRWSFTGNYDRGSTLSLIDRRDVFGLRDRARTRTETGNAEFVANGNLFAMPAGNVSTTLKGGLERLVLESESTRSGVEQTSDLARDIASIQANIDVPIARRSRDVLAAIGDLSVNFNANVENLSDFGTLRTLGAGFNWSPIAEVDVIGSVTDEDGAPTVQQLGDPVVLVPNVRVFDFTRGETVDVARLEGGNPDLDADNRRVWKLGINIRPLRETDLSLSANYINSRTTDAIASFPTATPEIEAAFPERFQRDADGRLFRIDSRPVNFERVSREQLRWGINFSKPIASARPPRENFPNRWRERFRRGAGGGPGGGGAPGEPGAPAAPGAEGQPGQAAQGQPGQGAAPTGEAGERGRGRRGGGEGGWRGGGGEGGWRGGGGGGGGQGGWRGGGGRGGFGGGRGGRLQFSLYHTWHFKDEILIREGVPVLDLLEGSATGNRGGQPRHEIEFQAGISKNGLGARLTADWQSGTTVEGALVGGQSSDLRFSDIATVNLRLFANLGEQASLIRRFPWLRQTRVTLSVNNLFNSRLRVTDETGTTPLSYQPDYLDPLGRSVRISIRKLFF